MMEIKDLIPWARHTQLSQSKDSPEEHPITSLQREMNRVFESFWKGFDQFGPNDSSLGDLIARSDVVETDGAIEVSIELPGVDEEDIQVSISDDSLSIKGEKRIERQDDKKGYFVSERSYGTVERTIALPPGLDSSKAEATFSKGVLTVSLPQSEAAKAKVRRIEVKSA